MSIKSVRICFASLLVCATAAWAGQASGPARMEGNVTDSTGKAVASAEIHLKGADGSGERITRTDENGRYGIGKLPVTDYEIALFVNGQVKASLNNMKVWSNKPTTQNFKLTGKYAAANPVKKHTHMVYIPAETGSNLSGRWVEVDDTTGNSSAATAGTGHLDRGGNAMLKSLQGSSGTSGGGN